MVPGGPEADIVQNSQLRRGRMAPDETDGPKDSGPGDCTFFTFSISSVITFAVFNESISFDQGPNFQYLNISNVRLKVYTIRILISLGPYKRNSKVRRFNVPCLCS